MGNKFDKKSTILLIIFIMLSISVILIFITTNKQEKHVNKDKSQQEVSTDNKRKTKAGIEDKNLSINEVLEKYTWNSVSDTEEQTTLTFKNNKMTMFIANHTFSSEKTLDYTISDNNDKMIVINVNGEKVQFDFHVDGNTLLLDHTKYIGINYDEDE